MIQGAVNPAREVFRLSPDGKCVQFHDVQVTLQEACDGYFLLLAYLREHPEVWPDVAGKNPSAHNSNRQEQRHGQGH